MTETEKVKKVLENKEEHTADEWIVALLSSIASSLAVIADKLAEGNK